MFSLVIKQKVFLLCRPGAAVKLFLRSLVYLRTQCRNESLKIEIHKNTRLENLYYQKKLQCKRHVTHTQLVQLAS